MLAYVKTDVGRDEFACRDINMHDFKNVADHFLTHSYEVAFEVGLPPEYRVMVEKSTGRSSKSSSKAQIVKVSTSIAREISNCAGPCSKS